ncbi:hypothetical protein NDU88_001711 [Pleurodeles waltl]|uniref:Uncharacterized protein n=1 Tax=Pleurodeles waltl TaxID=8319 RepID=A0AAV7KQ57_PLEWA|nr:hypothetical protein NDU88_001711 [Pleurodeles waltl]
MSSRQLEKLTVSKIEIRPTRCQKCSPLRELLPIERNLKADNPTDLLGNRRPQFGKPTLGVLTPETTNRANRGLGIVQPLLPSIDHLFRINLLILLDMEVKVVTHVNDLLLFLVFGASNASRLLFLARLRACLTISRG